jgi:hypothetical protein
VAYVLAVGFPGVPKGSVLAKGVDGRYRAVNDPSFWADASLVESSDNFIDNQAPIKSADVLIDEAIALIESGSPVGPALIENLKAASLALKVAKG